jgi:prepilin-type N-terminal cleavage/methylation domain-containing protein
MIPPVPIPLRRAQAGFTLVEMLVAVVAAAVLVMTMGSMLWYGFLGLNRTKQSVALQRDMRASMVALAQITHSATGLSFSTSGVYTAWYSNAQASVSAVTNSLFLTGVGGGVQQLAYGTLQTFTGTVSNNVATVALALGDAGDTISNQVVLFKRN